MLYILFSYACCIIVVLGMGSGKRDERIPPRVSMLVSTRRFVSRSASMVHSPRVKLREKKKKEEEKET